MTPRAYSSLEAFITHWRALRTTAARAVGGAVALNAAESELFRAMERVLGALDPTERAALESTDAPTRDDRTSAAANARARRRQRALSKLCPILAAAGWLQ